MLYILDKIDEAVSEFLTTLQIPRGHNIIFQAKWNHGRSQLNHTQSSTSVIRPDTLYLEPCNFALSIFQDFVFTYFKQERQCLCNYRLLKLILGTTKRKNNTEF